MATHVDAGHAVKQSALSGVVGEAPPVVRDVTYDRIRDARSEPSLSIRS